MFQRHREDSPYWEGFLEGSLLTLCLIVVLYVITRLFQ